MRRVCNLVGLKKMEKSRESKNTKVMLAVHGGGAQDIKILDTVRLLLCTIYD